MRPGSPVRGLRLGAVRDDGSPAWRNFYPDGLPEDWKLAFYGHYWKDLLLPAGDWTRAVRDTGWLADVPGDLRLYLELPSLPDEDPTPFGPLAVALDLRLGGVLLPADAGPPVGVGARRVFRRESGPHLPDARQVARFAGPEGVVLVLEPEPGLTLARWRGLLESAAGLLPDARQPVFLHAGPGELENAETILRLSGLG
jgi:hypothetical protein